ncbi:histidine kinase [Streptomyces sp. NPDC006660]|uniref:sensor histidine kinase n=1 Tax=Streptomyces sp. NPDC006660 TaxID=3156901 RepID=UPI0033C753EF
MTAERLGHPEGIPADIGSVVLPPRKAIAVTVVALLGFFVTDAVYLWAENPPWWQRAAALVCFVAIMGLQLIHSFPHFLPALHRHRYATWGLQAVLAYAPLPLFGFAWSGMAEFLTASSVLVLPAVFGWPLFGVGVLTCWGLYSGRGTSTVAYNVIEGALIPLVVIGLSRMSDMIIKLHRTREELSRLAVAGERLRFARDVHDVLGLGLSAISLKCELAYRLLGEAPARASEELGEVLRASRGALAEVRSVSRGYREMSLLGEADAAVSMLSAAGIRTTVSIETGALPAAVDTVLAAALREGLTNLLRHSNAERCEIRAELRDGSALLTLVNDGVGRTRPLTGAPDGGLAALGCRIGQLGGSLGHGGDGRGRFRLEAAVPLPHRPLPHRPQEDRDTDPGAGPRADGAARPPAPARGHRDLVPRAATAMTLTVLTGYFLAYAVVAASYDPPPGHAAATGLCLSATFLLQLAISFQWRSARLSRHGRPLRLAALAGLLLLHCLPWFFLGPDYLGMPGFVAGLALLVLPPAAAWPVLVAMTVAGGVSVQLSGGSFQDVTYESAYTVICALVVYGLSRMAQLACDLHRSRAEIARLAVTTERLRFARDLHDLLGFGLSAITLKCELVRRLAGSRPDVAREELREVLSIARGALADVRTVAEGRQRLSLVGEVESAVAVLEGAGIRATVDTDGGELPGDGDVETVLATVVREGVTNVLRHSRAARCEIRVRRTAAGGVRLTVVNDGVGACGVGACGVVGPGSGSGGGSGIANLTTRMSAVNGRLVARERADGWFELTAEVDLLDAGA